MVVTLFGTIHVLPLDVDIVENKKTKSHIIRKKTEVSLSTRGQRTILLIKKNSKTKERGLVKLQKKVVFGATLINKRIYWPENIKGDEINAHFDLK